MTRRNATEPVQIGLAVAASRRREAAAVCSAKRRDLGMVLEARFTIVLCAGRRLLDAPRRRVASRLTSSDRGGA